MPFSTDCACAFFASTYLDLCGVVFRHWREDCASKTARSVLTCSIRYWNLSIALATRNSRTYLLG